MEFILRKRCTLPTDDISIKCSLRDVIKAAFVHFYLLRGENKMKKVDLSHISCEFIICWHITLVNFIQFI